MNPTQSSSNQSVWKKLLIAHIQFSERHRFLIVIVSMVLSAVCGWYATHLRIDGNLDALLPRNTETIHAMKEAKLRLGSSDLYTIAIAMDDPVALATLQKRVADSLKKWPDVVYAQIERDNSFFRKHALLYLPHEQLKKISQKIEDLRMDLGKQGPLTVDLFDDEPAPDTKATPKREWFDADCHNNWGFRMRLQNHLLDFSKKIKTQKKIMIPRMVFPILCARAYLAAHVMEDWWDWYKHRFQNQVLILIM